MSRKNARKRRANVPQQERREEPQEPPRKRRLGDWFTAEWVVAYCTFVLMIFAIAAWRESAEGTKAMRGQLSVMQEQLKSTLSNQEPLFGAIVKEPPILQDSRIYWNVTYVNVGAGEAHDFRMQKFIRTNDVFRQHTDEFSLDNIDDSPGRGTEIMAHTEMYTTVMSGPGMSDEDFAAIVQSGTLSMLLHVKYRILRDGPWKDQWFCFLMLKSGAVSDQSIASCFDLLPKKYGGNAADP